MDKKTEMIGFKTTPQIKEILKTLADQQDRSISYIINQILYKALINDTNKEEVEQ